MCGEPMGKQSLRKSSGRGRRCRLRLINLIEGHYTRIRKQKFCSVFPFEAINPPHLSMNLGFVEPYSKREWFVVERFSAVVVPFRHARKSALKRSTTNLSSRARLQPSGFGFSPLAGEGVGVSSEGR